MNKYKQLYGEDVVNEAFPRVCPPNASKPTYSQIYNREYSFSEDESKILEDLYSRLLKKYGDKKLANEVYIKLISSVIYSDQKWVLIGASYSKDELDKLYEELEVKNEGIKELIESQYYNSGTNRNTTDYAHLMGTLSAHVNSNVVGKIGGSVAGLFGIGGGTIESAAGWAGDIYGIPGVGEPSMNSADYNADLDAVNINSRIKKNHEISIHEITMKYYEEIKNGNVNRADEFLINLGRGDKEKGLINVIHSSTYASILYADLVEYYDSKKAIEIVIEIYKEKEFGKFVDSLNKSSNTYIDK